MKQINELLNKRTYAVGKTKVNQNYEEAKEFGDYVGLPVFFVLKLFKLYGKSKVLGLRSWLGDINADPKRYKGLVIWKLKQVAPVSPR